MAVVVGVAVSLPVLVTAASGTEHSGAAAAAGGRGASCTVGKDTVKYFLCDVPVRLFDGIRIQALTSKLTLFLPRRMHYTGTTRYDLLTVLGSQIPALNLLHLVSKVPVRLPDVRSVLLPALDYHSVLPT
jgi:hypothetical protein